MLRKLRNIYHFLLWALQIVRLFRYLNRNRPAIITYCGITSPEHAEKIWNIDGRHISKISYERQIRYIKKHYKTIPLDELAKCVTDKKQFPAKAVALIFDYGYMNAYLNAFNTLDTDSIPFAVSIVTEFIDSKDFLWFDRLEFTISKSRRKKFSIRVGETFLDAPLTSRKKKVCAYRKIEEMCSGFDLEKREMLLQEIEKQTEQSLGAELTIPENYRGIRHDAILDMSKSGIKIGSYSAHLLDLTSISVKDLRGEILESKKKIEEITGGECSFFTYPVGKSETFNEEIINFIEKCGYSFALTAIPGFLTKNSNPYALPRIHISGGDTIFTFAAKLAGIGLRRK